VTINYLQETEVIAKFIVFCVMLSFFLFDLHLFITDNKLH